MENCQEICQGELHRDLSRNMSLIGRKVFPSNQIPKFCIAMLNMMREGNSDSDCEPGTGKILV